MTTGIVRVIELVAEETSNEFRWQLLNQNVTGAKLKRNGSESEVSFLTDPSNLSPNDLVNPNDGRVGVLFWLDRDKFEKALEIAKSEGE